VSKDLAVTLFDLAWLLPRTIGAEAGRLPHSELEMMRLLVRQPGLSVSEVASALELQSSNVSTAMRSLVGRGLIERRPDERDGRVTRLYPTGTAIAHRDEQEAAWGEELTRRLAQLPADERRRLLAAATALESLAGLLR